MKHTTILFTLLLFALGMNAQQGNPRHHDRHPEVTQMLQDLTPRQKRQIDAIYSKSREKLESARKEQRIVRDSIQMLIDSDFDYTKKISILFDREARLQFRINMEMYNTKLAIDKVLTKEQREELRTKMKLERRQRECANHDCSSEKAQRKGSRARQ